MKVSKKDIFGNPVRETSKEKQQRFEALSAALQKSHEMSAAEQEELLNEIVVMIADKD